MSLIQGTTGDWEVVIGLEVHAQVISRAKLFSGAATAFGAEPNTQVSVVDAAMPGMLPVINEYCLEQAVRTGLGLKAKINLRSVFDRKNYFYPDLPAGYQISQYHQPIVGKGTVILDLADGSVREVGITRLHLEQDAGKSLHDQHPSRSYVDLNRCGVALMEIVSEPDMRSAEEAALFLRKLRTILRYLGTCDGNMEQGSMRADVNVSVRRPGDSLGTRSEIKNLNSVRFVQQAIGYESRRQIELLEAGGEVRQATCLFDSRSGVTREMRTKEEAHDYRYFPDPDLLPLVLDEAWVARIAASLPELPDEKKARFIREYELSPYQASVLVADKEVAQFFEQALTARKSSKALRDWMEYPSQHTGEVPNEVSLTASITANWVISDLFGALNKAKIDISNSPVTPVNSASLLDLQDQGVISARVGKNVFEVMFETGGDAARIVEEKGLRQMSDEGAIEDVVEAVLTEQADKVADYKAGKEKLFGWLVGQVMKATQGKANPKLVNEVLRRKLGGGPV